VRTSAEAATSAEEATSEEAAVNKGKQAHIVTMDKPAKPPDRLDEQFAAISAVFVQELEEPGEPGKPEEPAELEEPEEPGDLEELEEYRKLEEDLVWVERPPGEHDWPMPVRMDWSRGCGAEDTEYIPGQAGPPAKACACIEVPAEREKAAGGVAACETNADGRATTDDWRHRGPPQSNKRQCRKGGRPARKPG
jgi:hypothetical protein